MGNASSSGTKQRRWPKRIILVRHGESEKYNSQKGIEQAKKAGELSRGVVGKSKVYFYVSPFLRTRETLNEIGAAFSSSEITGVSEECRLREMDYAKFNNIEKMEEYKKEV
ncbi:hypothetical protein HAX54_039888 [Datura stramonium]|uniref:Phosphoglycerate mutase n=1 Tax=Datura stramonium TaxID=4076 RepID=A0ABS8VN83_DATST|nr:hypothetical protein [Datura stramonium]